MVQIAITRDSDTGVISGKITPENKTLEDYFETEIQNDSGIIRHLRKKLMDSDGTDVELIGNAYYLALGPETFTVRPLFEPGLPPATGPTGDFLFLLDQWADFLLNKIG
ncbi:MAG: hypothetical protein K9G33_16820 [Sneathiella sp.]|nr:hypothetical protein [Sneathiella sp.]